MVNATATARSDSGYRCLVASVDHALFDSKDSLRARGRRPAGELVDAGMIDLTVAPTRPNN